MPTTRRMRETPGWRAMPTRMPVPTRNSIRTIQQHRAQVRIVEAGDRADAAEVDQDDREDRQAHERLAVLAIGPVRVARAKVGEGGAHSFEPGRHDRVPSDPQAGRRQLGVKDVEDSRLVGE